LKDLVDAGLWNERLKNQLIASGGSIQVLSHNPRFFLCPHVTKSVPISSLMKYNITATLFGKTFYLLNFLFAVPILNGEIQFVVLLKQPRSQALDPGNEVAP
jgi:hypothetical protein